MDLKKVLYVLGGILLLIPILNFFFFNLGAPAVFALYYWILILGLGSFLGTLILDKAHEKLLAFSIPLGLLFCAWIAWLILHIIPYNFLPLLMAFGGALALTRLTKKRIQEALVYQVAFISIFLLFLILTSFHPEIYWGEKPMDFNLINFMGRNTSFPPEDPWFPGHVMKYYYFGYFMFAKLASPLNISGELIYPMSLASSAGFFFLASLALLKSFNKEGLVKYLGASILLFITSVGGILGYFFEGKMGANAFWASTRVFINNGFAEYPFWSFVFGDLHPHVMSYGFSLFALVLIILYAKGEDYKGRPQKSLLLGFSLSALMALNAWDLIFLGLFFIFILVVSKGLKKERICSHLWMLGGGLIGALCWSPILLSLLGGKGVSARFYEGDHNSPLNYLVHQGMPWLLLLIFLGVMFYKKRKNSFSMILLCLFFIMLILTEFFVVMDRMNTIFKFGNQLFILLTVTALSLVEDTVKERLLLGVFLLICLFLAGFDQVNSSKYNAFGTTRPTLRGTAYMEKVAAEDKKMIDFINQKIGGTPLFLEAYGKSFDNNKARISSQTGVPTYLGWEGHVFIRGANPRETLRRKKEIDGLYQSTDALKSYEWLIKKGIEYVVVGGAEHSKYPIKGLAKFEQYVDLFTPLVQTKKGNLTFGLYKVGK